jgi:hypothetical protein
MNDIFCYSWEVEIEDVVENKCDVFTVTGHGIFL